VRHLRLTHSVPRAHRQAGNTQPCARRVATLALVATLGLVAAACSDDGDSPSTSPSTTPETSTPMTQTPSTQAPTTAAPTTIPPTTGADAFAATRFDQRGPYGVGVTTLSLADRKVEVFYPADPAATAGAPTDSYRTADVFPEGLRALVPPAMDGTFDVGAVRDVAATTDGPFPIVIYSHGFGGYRQVANFYLAHLASWGFVVASADHVERSIVALATGQLSDAARGKDLDDVVATIAALEAENTRAGGLLEGRVNPESIGITGHSAGAQTALRAAGSNDRIDAFVSISGGLSLMGEPAPSIPGKPALVVAGELDKVVEATKSAALYEGLGSPKYHVEIAGAGHNSFTDSCPGILERGGLEALRSLLGPLVDLAQDGCVGTVTDPLLVQQVLDHYSVAFFLTHLGVRDEAASITGNVTGVLGGISLSTFAHA